MESASSGLQPSGSVTRPLLPWMYNLTVKASDDFYISGFKSQDRPHRIGYSLCPDDATLNEWAKEAVPSCVFACTWHPGDAWGPSRSVVVEWIGGGTFFYKAGDVVWCHRPWFDVCIVDERMDVWPTCQEDIKYIMLRYFKYCLHWVMARQHIVKDGWRAQWQKFVEYESKVTPYNSITDATSEELGREAMSLYDWAEQNPVVATRCLSMELRMADWGVEGCSAASSPSVDSDQSIDDDGGEVSTGSPSI